MTNPAPDSAVAIADFAEVAATFCALLDRPPESNTPAMLLAQCLARLHVAALCLPDVTDDDAPDPGPAPKPLSLTSWAEVTPVDGYWDVFDPLSLDPESPVFNSLVDDLSDIYNDLRCGLELYDAGFQFGAAWHYEVAELSPDGARKC